MTMFSIAALLAPVVGPTHWEATSPIIIPGAGSLSQPSDWRARVRVVLQSIGIPSIEKRNERN